MKRDRWLLRTLLRRTVLCAFLGGLLLAAGWSGSTRAETSEHVIRLLYATFDPLRDGEPAVPPELQAPPDSPYALLQFVGPVQPEWVTELQEAGVVFYGYVPRYAYTVNLAGADPAAVGEHPAVRWVGPLHPAYKISPTLSGDRLLLALYPDADPESVAAAVAAAGATLLGENADANLLSVEAGQDLAPALAAVDGVRWVQNDAPLQEMNDDARWVTQGGVLETTPLYDRGLTGAGQVGGVADSGLAVYDFSGEPDPLYNAVPSCYFIDDSDGAALPPGRDHRKVVAYTIPPGAGGDHLDSSGHGSHVVGTVTGDRSPWGQPSPADGQAYDARIFFQDIATGVAFPQDPVVSVNPPDDYRVLFGQAYDPNGDGRYQPDVEPRTHSNSWGSTDPIYSIESAQTDAFMWEHPDFLILFAAGNQGPAPSTIGYPATAKNVVTVGATENGMADTDSMAYFSSHGPGPMTRLKPTVSAPGDRITSAAQGDPCAAKELSGTSMATPAVHGTALLMRQYLADGFYPSGEARAADARHPSAALLKALLINAGRPMAGMYTDDAWPSNGQGWGRVTAGDALYLQGDHRALWLHDEYALDGGSGFAAPGETRTFTVHVGDGSPFSGEPLKVALAWSDYPGTPLAGELVNDLNLTVIGPDGNIYLGNDPASNDFRGSPPLPALTPDDVNPWEVVYVEEPQPGAYTVTVTAANLGSLALDPGDKQGYALAVTGDLLGARGRAEIEYPMYEPNPAEVARLRLSDLDLNQDPAAVEEAAVRVSGPGGEVQATLLETGADTGVFAGSVTLTAADAHPGALPVSAGDVIRLTYEDADDGRGEAVVAYDTARIAPRPLNFINPPALSASADGSLRWDPPAETTGLTGYVMQATTAYTVSLADAAEGDIGAHWTTGQLDAPWRSDIQYQNSGLSSFWSGRGDTGVLIDTALALREPVAVPHGATSARLGFYSRYFNDFNDNGFVEISVDGGPWVALRRLYADPRVPPPDTIMRYHQFDLTPYVGQTIRVRFRYNNGVLSFAPDSPGWWVDDVTISGGAWQMAAVVGTDVTQMAAPALAPGHNFYRLRALYADGSATGWSNVVEKEIIADPTGGAKTTGGGWLGTYEGEKINFGFQVEETNDGFQGRLKLKDGAAGVQIWLDEVSYLGAPTAACGGFESGSNVLEIRGSGRFNDAEGASFRTCVEDNGEPGRGNDRFYLTCLADCSYDTAGRAPDDILDGGNVQVQQQQGSGSDVSSEPEPATVILDPLLLSEVVPDDLLTFSVTVYDQHQQPLANAPVTVTRTGEDGTTTTFTAMTDVTGVAILQTVSLYREATYIATAGTAESNAVAVSPFLH